MPSLSIPAIFISHGGGPCFWITPQPPLPPDAFDKLAQYLGGLLSSLPEKPSAILVVTAHWETGQPTFATNANPGMLYDYSGFPKHTYELKFPAPGAPPLADRARALLTASGIESGADPHRGFDHGVFVPMLKILPEADIPVLQMSICSNFDPERLIAIGRALMPLRDEGVLIIGSGLSFHNLQDFMAPDGGKAAIWNAWLIETVTDPDPTLRNRRLAGWTAAPFARFAQPREDHLMPLMLVAGAAGSDRGRQVYSDQMLGKPVCGFQFG